MITTKQASMPSPKMQENNKPVNMPFVRQSRSSWGIMWDILQACMDAGADGIAISKISQKANLSHGVVVYNCKRLTDAEIIKTNKINKKYIFVITEKGIKIFHEFQRFHEMTSKINIRY